MIDNRLWLNPGSCGPRRFAQEITMAVMTVDNGTYQWEKVAMIPEKYTEDKVDWSGGKKKYTVMKVVIICTSGMRLQMRIR